MAQLPSQSQFGDYGEWPGRDVLDSGGERLGGVREIYLDRETGRPEWVLVDVDGDEARFVPLADASVESSRIRVAHSAEAIRSAPGIGSEPRIDQSEERRLYDHYGLGYSETDSGSGLPEDPAPEAEAPVTGSWSEAAEEQPSNLAPPPAEPPSPEEIEAAEIREPSAADEPVAAVVAPEPDDGVPSAGGPIDDPVVVSEPGVTVAPSSAGEILAAAPEAEDLKAQPGPDAVRPVTPLEPPRPQQPPPPEPEPASGPLDVVAARKREIAAGAAIAAVLLLVIRRLR